MEKSFEFIGTPTGDGESFCWEVDKETWMKFYGREPEQYEYIFLGSKNGELLYSKDKLYLYPDILFQRTDDIYNVEENKFNKPINIKIQWKES